MSDLGFPATLAPAAESQPARLPDPRARSFFRRSTVQTRLTIAFWAVGAMSLLGTLLGIWQVGEMHQRARADLRVERLAGELHAAASSNVVRATALAAATDPAVAQALAAGFRATEQRIQQLHGELAQAVSSPAGQALLEQVATRRKDFQAAYDAALRARVATLEGVPAPPTLAAAGEAHLGATRAVLDFHGGEGEGAAALQAQARRASLELIALFVVMTVLTVPVVVALFVHILRPMHIAVRIASKVAGGDLSLKVRTGGSDEMARLMLALDDMTENLRRIVGEVTRSAAAMAGTGAQVRQGQMDLAYRTEAQASTLQQTAASIEGLTAMVSQNAQTARQASELAAGAARIAGEGGDMVGRVVTSMRGISGSARRIGEISSVIDGIAFQTNILALNAAVEAARAGDQGRGFAVVAAEVRNLAQRSAQAAREIKGLIGESVGQVDEGAKLVDAAGRTMEEIVASVRKVSGLIAEIAAAGEEQKAGIEQVNAAIADMDRAVQQNAALVDQASQSTEALHTHSNLLLRSVSQFRLRDDAPATLLPLEHSR